MDFEFVARAVQSERGSGCLEEFWEGVAGLEAAVVAIVEGQQGWARSAQLSGLRLCRAANAAVS